MKNRASNRFTKRNGNPAGGHRVPDRERREEIGVRFDSGFGDDPRARRGDGEDPGDADLRGLQERVRRYRGRECAP
ncbi:uncharacterized protein G2W53_022031 [Senna tora]|uniref:Uncharacterized protein n=1 Tax=Senna tora TaxID=362788 RepID=A0A834TKM1_9FABA|nr:uncharacterized protein G2W53_022031 [Senna tora]